MYGTVLVHHGITGMHWGIRRFQNEDGTLTEAGRIRYSKNEASKEAASAAYTHANSDSLAKKISKIATIGSYGSRQTYNMARAAGEGRVKSFLRAKLDLNVATLTGDAAKGLIGKGMHQILKNTSGMKSKILIGLAGGAAGLGTSIGANRFITDEMAAKGKVASVQQAILRNKYYRYKKEEKKEEAST